MAIRMMVDKSRASEPGIIREVWDGHEVFMETTHVGLVLETRERNGYNDSDFYAVVWNPEKGKTEHIEYGTTRFWTYPNSASVDATPEVRAAYEAWQTQCREAERARSEAERAKMPDVGKRVRIIGGRKVPKGTECEVFWFGKDSFQEARSRRYANPYASLLGFHYHPEEYRVGVRLLNGNKVFVSAKHVEIIGG